jgi:pyruvate dehydrogenase E2 component (dihydrolipoamide acetyltransferase)
VDLGTLEGKGKRGRITKADVIAAAEDLAGPGKVRATPAARRIAREQGLDLAAVTGSGPHGRVQAADVAAGEQGLDLRTTSRSAFIRECTHPRHPRPGAPETGRGEAVVVPLAGMRRTIAERMTASYQTAPHITFTVRVDMSGFEQVRAQFNAKAQAIGQPRASVTALIVKTVAWALQRHPYLNSTLGGEEIHLLPEVNLGVAVALEEGLIVPVVHDADHKGVGEIAAEVHDLTIRAREGRLAPADVAGGTFTVSNLGPFGIEQFTAIINPPQAAILAVGTTQPEPVVDEGGQVVVRPIMRMTLSADHRIVDGAIAARFLADLREALEAPALILW